MDIIINKIYYELNREPVILKIKENINKDESTRLEIQLIKIMGRININTGILSNLTDGGEGTYGNILSEKSKNKIRMKALGRKCSDEFKEKCRNKFFSEETREKIRQKALGRKPSKEAKQNMSIAQKNRPRSVEEMERAKTLNKGYYKGRKLTDEHKKHIGEGNKGKIATFVQRERSRRFIYILSNGENYDRYFSSIQKNTIKQKFLSKKSNIIFYKDLIIVKILKEDFNTYVSKEIKYE